MKLRKSGFFCGFCSWFWLVLVVESVGVTCVGAKKPIQLRAESVLETERRKQAIVLLQFFFSFFFLVC